MIAVRAERPVDPAGRTMFHAIERDGVIAETIGYVEVVVRGSARDYRCACTYFDSKPVPMITSTVAIVDPTRGDARGARGGCDAVSDHVVVIE